MTWDGLAVQQHLFMIVATGPLLDPSFTPSTHQWTFLVEDAP